MSENDFKIAGGVLLEYTGERAVVGIPNTVTRIGDKAFSFSRTAKHIIIPATVTEIGSEAFSHCDALLSVLIPDSVEKIAPDAFLLSMNVNIMASASSYAAKYAELMGLGFIRVGNRDEKSGEIKIENPAPDKFNIKGSVLLSYSGDEKTVVIPNGVTKIGANAFSYNGYIECVFIPPSVVEIGECAFDHCDRLAIADIPNSVVRIRDKAFSWCDALERVELPPSVKFIGEEAYSWNDNITEIILSDSVERISDGAFSFCPSIRSISFPASVNSIGVSVLEGCDNLESITVEEGNPHYHSAGECLIHTSTKTLVAGCKSSVIPTDGSVTVIGNSAFAYNEGVVSIVIPDTVTEIGESAFIRCELKELVIPTSVKKISNRAFQGNSFLHNVYIPPTLDKFETEAFFLCGDLVFNVVRDSMADMYARFNNIEVNYVDVSEFAKSDGERELPKLPVCTVVDGVLTSYYGDEVEITLPDKVHEIGEEAFKGRADIVKVTLPRFVTKIGRGAFAGCSGLKEIVFSDRLHSIESDAFTDCSSLVSLRFPCLLKSIGDYAFFGCESLVSVYIPTAADKIGRGVFAGCSSLNEIRVHSANKCYKTEGNCLVDVKSKAIIAGTNCSAMPENAEIKAIGELAFANLKGLRSFTLPSSTLFIMDGAFMGCENLSGEIVGERIVRIGALAFKGCKSLEAVNLSERTFYIASGSFEGCENLVVRAPALSVAANYAEKNNIRYERTNKKTK